jgi:ribose 5-phosphate isomerase A
LKGKEESLVNQDEAKKERAAEEAVKEVTSGQILGLGTGSTAKYAVIKIGERFRAGQLKNIVGVPTSEATRALAAQYGIPLAPIEKHAIIDLAIDGADEVDGDLNLLKGLGGALLREKMVERKAKRLVVIVDESKLVERLGTKSVVPIEVAPDKWRSLFEPLRALGGIPMLREDAGGQPLATDQQNYLIDCRFASGIDDAYALAKALDALPDVIGHGLFLDMADSVIVADDSGTRRIDRKWPRPPPRG